MKKISTGKTKAKTSTRQRKANIAGYCFIGLYIIGFLWLRLYPFARSLYLSFTDYSVFYEPKWIGLDNYIEMFFKDEDFWPSMWVTFKFSIIGVPVKLAASLLIAVIMSYKSKATNFYRTLYYIPSLLGSGVACALTWKQLWVKDGAINKMLALIGIEGPSWLVDTRYALYVIILLGVWQFGSQMIVYLAAIKGVPATYHEAAIMDGAGPVRRFFKITFPMITYATFFNLINGIIGSLQAFNSAFLVTNGGPLKSTNLYALYQYRQAFSYGHMGYACAMAWFLMLVIAVLTVFVFKRSSAWVYYQDEM